MHDQLVSPALVDEAPPTALRIFAGKSGGRHCVAQSAINALLIHHAEAGRLVVRLKGGDPFVFGRGGEEALACLRAKIPVEVVPGVSSAVAVPAAAGIPVSHRGLGSSFAVVTGHEDPNKPEASVDWARLATAVDTLVILMGMSTLPTIAARLIAAGRDAETPAAVIEQGTTAKQRTVTGTLGNIAITRGPSPTTSSNRDRRSDQSPRSARRHRHCQPGRDARRPQTGVAPTRLAPRDRGRCSPCATAESIDSRRWAGPGGPPRGTVASADSRRHTHKISWPRRVP